MRVVRVLGLAVVASLLAACENAPTSPMLAVDALADKVPDPTNPGRITYTFDELQESCGFLITSPPTRPRGKAAWKPPGKRSGSATSASACASSRPARTPARRPRASGLD